MTSKLNLSFFLILLFFIFVFANQMGKKTVQISNQNLKPGDAIVKKIELHNSQNEYHYHLTAEFYSGHIELYQSLYYQLYCNSSFIINGNLYRDHNKEGDIKLGQDEDLTISLYLPKEAGTELIDKEANFTLFLTLEDPYLVILNKMIHPLIFINGSLLVMLQLFKIKWFNHGDYINI